MYELFANTGVQLLFFPVQRADFAYDETHRGWQRCFLAKGSGKGELPFIQWQWVDSPSRIFLAVDTTCGDPRRGYFVSEETLVADQTFVLGGLLDAKLNKPLEFGRRLDDEGKPIDDPLRFLIRARGDGDPRDVHLAVDFGNSRTGALLLELSGATHRNEDMLPLDLINRFRLDAWDERGLLRPRADSRWFTSQTHWCTTPYLAPEPRIITATRKELQKGKLFGTKEVYITEEFTVKPALFDDLSLVRMGREAVDVTNAIRGEGRPYTGLSSPKRYLWAGDSQWLEGADWHMADPFDRHNHEGRHVAKLQGSLLRFFDQNDSDRVLEADAWTEADENPEAAPLPRYAPRVLMTAALYEIMCQSFALINSIGYRRRMGDESRMRRLISVNLSFPSGMIAPERERLLHQARKAARVFQWTLGKKQQRSVDANLSIDEASAVHLTYIWSELQLIGNNPKLWFELTGRLRGDPKMAVAGAAEQLPNEVRIACVDIGGGTTDLMIALYRYKSDRAIQTIQEEVLHRDGISLAGDQLMKRLLETIVVPEFGRAVGLDNTKLQRLFGPEAVHNRGFRHLRKDWINRLFVPLAVTYLERAGLESQAPISHTDPQIVAAEVIESLQRKINELYGIGEFDVLLNDMRLIYDASAFERLVRNVFQDLLFDFCGRIVERDVDVVLLAGQPTKLKPIQDLIQSYLPLTSSRIVPMHNYYAGVGYPYQDEQGQNLGRIVDPKSAVVVGTAIHFLATQGMLAQLNFELQDPIRSKSYFWGILNDKNFKIYNDNLLFRGDDPSRQLSFKVKSDRLMIGRRLSPSETALPSPVYMLRVEGEGSGGIDLEVKLERYVAKGSAEELLRLADAKGTVRGRPAQVDANVRLDLVTLAHERYYLDSGSLDNIAMA